MVCKFYIIFCIVDIICYLFLKNILFKLIDVFLSKDLCYKCIDL